MDDRRACAGGPINPLIAPGASVECAARVLRALEVRRGEEAAEVAKKLRELADQVARLKE